MVAGILIAVFVVQLLSTALKMVTGNVGLWTFINLGLTIWLCWNVYSGKSLARLILAGLLTLGGLFGLFTMLPVAATVMRVSPILGLVLMSVSLLQIACGFSLYLMPQVRDYFRYVSNEF